MGAVEQRRILIQVEYLISWVSLLKTFTDSASELETGEALDSYWLERTGDAGELTVVEQRMILEL